VSRAAGPDASSGGEEWAVHRGLHRGWIDIHDNHKLVFKSLLRLLRKELRKACQERETVIQGEWGAAGVTGVIFFQDFE